MVDLLRVSEIRIGHVYFVDFDPVQPCEFDKRHLAVVLKKNNDNRTFVVIPLTSQPNGNQVNKIKLEDAFIGLPLSLNKNDTYAVFNQIRTVNANRFIAIKDSGNPVPVKIRSELFTRLLELCIKDLMHNVELDNRIMLLRQMYHKELLNKAINLAYHIIAANKKHDVDTEEIKRVESEIHEIISNIPYELDQSDIDNGVQAIFETCISCIDEKDVQ